MDLRNQFSVTGEKLALIRIAKGVPIQCIFKILQKSRLSREMLVLLRLFRLFRGVYPRESHQTSHSTLNECHSMKPIIEFSPMHSLATVSMDFGDQVSITGPS